MFEKSVELKHISKIKKEVIMAQLAKPSPVIKGSNLTIHKTFFIIVKNVLQDKNGEKVNQNIIMRQSFLFSMFSFTKPGFEPKISDLFWWPPHASG